MTIPIHMWICCLPTPAARLRAIIAEVDTLELEMTKEIEVIALHHRSTDFNRPPVSREIAIGGMAEANSAKGMMQQVVMIRTEMITNNIDAATPDEQIEWYQMLKFAIDMVLLHTRSAQRLHGLQPAAAAA